MHRHHYPAYITQSLTPDFPATSRVRNSVGRPGSGSTVSPDTFIDTSSASRAHFIEEQKGCPDATNYDVSQGSGSEDGNGIGYNFWQSCIGPYRPFYSFDVSASNSSWQVISAVLLLAASAAATAWGAIGPLDIARALWAGNYTDYFPGQVRDVQAFSYALSPGAVRALYLGQNPINQVS